MYLRAVGGMKSSSQTLSSGSPCQFSDTAVVLAEFLDWFKKNVVVLKRTNSNDDNNNNDDFYGVSTKKEHTAHDSIYEHGQITIHKMKQRQWKVEGSTNVSNKMHVNQLIRIIMTIHMVCCMHSKTLMSTS